VTELRRAVHFQEEARAKYKLIITKPSIDDSQFGRRIRGEGQEADAIHQLFRASKKKYFAGKTMPVYDLTKFRKGGSLSLF
jgi:hypothetical protein